MSTISDSILTSTKKILGLGEDYTAFDLDVITHINSILANMTQIGIGPSTGFVLEDADATWEDFLGDDPAMTMVRSYVYLRVRLLFDPPSTSFHIQSLKDQATEFEWRIREIRENRDWTPPLALPVRPPTIDGGLP